MICIRHKLLNLQKRNCLNDPFKYTMPFAIYHESKNHLLLLPEFSGMGKRRASQFSEYKQDIINMNITIIYR
jgi:hypothetical protein